MQTIKSNPWKKKWRKGRENEYERIVYEIKFKFNIWGSRGFIYIYIYVCVCVCVCIYIYIYIYIKRIYIKRKIILNFLCRSYLELIYLKKWGIAKKKPWRVLTEKKTERAIASKICLTLLLGIWTYIVAAFDVYK